MVYSVSVAEKALKTLLTVLQMRRTLISFEVGYVLRLNPQRNGLHIHSCSVGSWLFHPRGESQDQSGTSKQLTLLSDVVTLLHLVSCIVT